MCTFWQFEDSATVFWVLLFSKVGDFFQSSFKFTYLSIILWQNIAGFCELWGSTKSSGIIHCHVYNNRHYAGKKDLLEQPKKLHGFTQLHPVAQSYKTFYVII
jgi:hypothetical protein